MTTTTVHLAISWAHSQSFGIGWTQEFASTATRWGGAEVVAGGLTSCASDTSDFFVQSGFLLSQKSPLDRVLLFFPDILPTRSFAKTWPNFVSNGSLIAGVDNATGQLLYVAGRAQPVRDYLAVLSDGAASEHSRPGVIYRDNGHFLAKTALMAGSGEVHNRDGFVLRGPQSFWLDPDEDLPSKMGIDAQADFLVLEGSEPFALGLSRPFSEIANSINRLGFFCRQLSLRQQGVGACERLNGSEQRRYSLFDIDVVAVTTDRWKSVYWLLRSVRKNLGESVTITVVVQARRRRRWSRLSEKFNAKFLYVAPDFGLSAGRNLAIAATERRLVFLMDDDFMLDDRCRTLDGLKILSENPWLSVLGGNLLDVNHPSAPVRDEVSQGFAMECHSGPPDVTWMRLESFPRERLFVSESTYFERCDIVDNFALFVRENTFDRGLGWRPELKITSEHQAFFLDALLAEDVFVARTNALRVRNVRVQNLRYRVMRSRREFYDVWFEEQGLKSFEIVGLRSRFRDFEGVHNIISFHPRVSWTREEA